MTNKKDFIELGEWQLTVFKQRDEYRQVLIKIREIILKNDPECACNISNIIIKKINEVLGGSEDENSEHL